MAAYVEDSVCSSVRMDVWDRPVGERDTVIVEVLEGLLVGVKVDVGVRYVRVIDVLCNWVLVELAVEE